MWELKSFLMQTLSFVPMNYIDVGHASENALLSVIQYYYYLPQVLLLISFGQFEVQLTWCTMYHNKQLFWALSSLKCTTCTLELQNNDWSGIMVNPDLMSTILLGSIITGMSMSSNLACQINFFFTNFISQKNFHPMPCHLFSVGWNNFEILSMLLW